MAWCWQDFEKYDKLADVYEACLGKVYGYRRLLATATVVSDFDDKYEGALVAAKVRRSPRLCGSDPNVAVDEKINSNLAMTV